jgi:hypothetical protein
LQSFAVFKIYILILSISSLGGSLCAQDLEKDVQKPARDTTQQVQAAKLAEQAAQQTAPGEDVTWEEVMAHPDDIQLNYRYARQQVRRGDLKGAAATLERILMVDPDQHEVRLFYAVVLYRLDNMAEASRELDSLQTLPLPGALRQEADRYVLAVRNRAQRTQVSGSLSTGFEYDTNRNAAPASGQALFDDTPILLTGSSQRRDDTSILLMANAGIRHDLGSQAGHEIFANFNYYQAEQTLDKMLNLKAYSGQAGGVYKGGFFKATPELIIDDVELAQSTFLHDYGADVRFDIPYLRKTNFFFEVKDVMQQYMATTDIPTAAQRTGVQVDFTAGSEHLLGPSMKFGTLLGYSRKDAEQDYWAFSRWVAGVNHAWLMGKGTFLLSSFTFDYDIYNGWDPMLTPTAQIMRRDKTMRASATVGGPLAFIHPRLNDLVWTFTYEYYQALSNVMNYAYSNNKIAAMLTYRWEVGL